jgi:hypothetical protein
MESYSGHRHVFSHPFAIAATLLLGLTSSAMLYAGQHKVNVCHIDEYGTYQMLNIAEAAFQAHIGHGDSNPGDLVPGSDDQFSFADDCTLIPACPCVIDLPSGWLATSAISGIALEECADETFVESVFGTSFDDDDNASLSWGKSEQCDGPTSFTCSAGGNTRAISEAQYDVCLGTVSVP